jgi:hypothetical protein
VLKNLPKMDKKIEVTQKLREKCDTFLEAKKFLGGAAPEPPHKGDITPYSPNTTYQELQIVMKKF